MIKGVSVLCKFINSVRCLAAVVCPKSYESFTILLYFLNNSLKIQLHCKAMPKSHIAVRPTGVFLGFINELCCFEIMLSFRSFRHVYWSNHPFCPSTSLSPVLILLSAEQWQRDAAALCGSVRTHTGGAAAAGGADRPHHAQQQVWDAARPSCALRPAGGGQTSAQGSSQPAQLQHQETHPSPPGLPQRTPARGGGAAGRRRGYQLPGEEGQIWAGSGSVLNFPHTVCQSHIQT